MDARRQPNAEDGRNDVGMGQKLGHVNEHAVVVSLTANTKLLSWQPLYDVDLRTLIRHERQLVNCKRVDWEGLNLRGYIVFGSWSLAKWSKLRGMAHAWIILLGKWSGRPSNYGVQSSSCHWPLWPRFAYAAWSLVYQRTCRERCQELSTRLAEITSWLLKHTRSLRGRPVRLSLTKRAIWRCSFNEAFWYLSSNGSRNS